jgi:hypothetical protein
MQVSDTSRPYGPQTHLRCPPRRLERSTAVHAARWQIRWQSSQLGRDRAAPLPPPGPTARCPGCPANPLRSVPEVLVGQVAVQVHGHRSSRASQDPLHNLSGQHRHLASPMPRCAVGHVREGSDAERLDGSRPPDRTMPVPFAQHAAARCFEQPRVLRLALCPAVDDRDQGRDQWHRACALVLERVEEQLST